MDLTFTKSELYQVEPISGKKTLTVVNSVSNSKKQAIIVGDDSSKLTCFGIENSPVIYWSGSAKNSSAIYKIEKSGLDKIFISSGNSIEGWNKKGKNFFRLSTNSCESISSFSVFQTQLWIASQVTLNVYNNGKEIFNYWCDDVISDICILKNTDETKPVGVLGCQDRNILFIQV